MEFLSSNYLQTTTQLVVNSNTFTAQYVLSDDLTRQYVSDGFNNDLTTTTITVNFDETTSIDRIAFMGHNLKEFTIFYNGATANTFSITGPTTVSSFATNSTTSLYLQMATPVAVTSVTFDLKSTIVANSEKAVGQILLAANQLTFSRLPSADAFSPVIIAKELTHVLSTGGTRRHVIDKKWDVKIKFKFIDQDFRDDLKAIYDLNQPVTFVPFGTTTAWDGIIFEANWTGNFDFYKYSDDAVGAGFSGQIALKET